MIWCDNLSVVKPIFYACTKHAKVDYHFVRDAVSTKAIQFCFISSKDQHENILIKRLSTTSFIALKFKFQVEPPSSA